MPGFLSPRKGMPLLLIPEYSGINKGQRIPETISLRSFQFVVIYTVKGFNLVSKAEVDVFLECWQFHLCFLCLFKTQLVHLEVLGSCTSEA